MVRIEAVPEELLGPLIPGPVRPLGVDEDDAGPLVALVGVAPDVEVAGGRPVLALAGPLDPRVLVGGGVDHELRDHVAVAAMRLAHPALESRPVPVGRVVGGVTGAWV